MATRKKNIPAQNLSLTSEIGAVAKFSYEKKTEEIIPPDVTRAKSQTWLDLFSPLTQWAGLKGDSFYFKRLELRIHQEAALEQLADTIRKQLDVKPPSHPVHPKILIPALEGASLEGPNSPLLDWWANLLVSEAHGKSVRPYHVSLMNQLGPEEARFLESMWSPLYIKEDNTKRMYEKIKAELDSRLDFLDKEGIELEYFPSVYDLADWGKEQRIIFDSIELNFNISKNNDDSYPERYEAMPYRAEWTTAMRVCSTLNLLKIDRHKYYLNVGISRERERVGPDHMCEATLRVFTFNELGREFMFATRIN
jgi:hypothetical protein